ncbi:hypothetical protein AVEN_197584-1, partial [Araneus ventricosus]
MIPNIFALIEMMDLVTVVNS